MKNTIRAIILATLALAGTQVSTAAAPANDHWANAQLISGSSGVVTGTTVDATVQTCEPGHSFPDAGPLPANTTVWYRWTAPENGSYTFHIQSPLHTFLSAYAIAPGICNNAPANIPYRLAENDQYVMNNSLVLNSRLTLPFTAGATVYFSADSFLGSPGTFTLSWKKTKYRYTTSLDTRDPGTDLLITRHTPGGREWWFARTLTANSFGMHSAVRFGYMTDKRVIGDYNGDGLTDIVAARPENGHLTWWIANHTGSMIKVVTFGLDTDKPIAGDYDGDGISDIAVTRKEANGKKTWHVLRSKDGSYYGFQFGLATDRETVGDFDGDGVTDVVVLRDDALTRKYTWYILRSSDGSVASRQFGERGDIPQPADLDYDGRTDLAMFRAAVHPGTSAETGVWKWLSSAEGIEQSQVYSVQFGSTNDIPQVGDFDFDGKDDIGIYRNGVWWLKRTRYSGSGNIGFGTLGDMPGSDIGVVSLFTGLVEQPL